MTMKELEKKLRRQDYHQAKLYLFCNFISLMLITAYSIMMMAPTVLEVLPEGGDSRKQMVAIFVLAAVGCVAFTVYATALFFRKKSRQVGILMALGASKRQLAPMLYREVLVLGFASSVCGMAAGFPFVVLIWNGFRLLIVDSKEMVLNIRMECLGIPFVFLVLVMVLACVTAKRYLKRTDILDTIQEEHKNEPIKELGKWCGPAGIVILLAGAVIAYYAPEVYMKLTYSYGGAWLNLLYIPVFIGLYMMLLHTVVYGWHFKKRVSYKNLVSRSMMKFQGKQTVNNLLVSTVLLAGACFAVFYVPSMASGNFLNVRNRTYDYLYDYRADQKVPGREETENLAAEYGVSLKDWHEVPYISLGMDGMAYKEDGNKFYYEYEELETEGNFFSEEDFRELTGLSVTVEPGTYLAVSDNGDSIYSRQLTTDSTLFTHMVTEKTLEVRFADYVCCDFLAGGTGYYILNDADYKKIAEGITGEWSGRMTIFNADGKDDYRFAERLFHTLVSSFDKSCEIPYYYDRVQKISDNKKGDTYWGDMDMAGVNFEEPDSSAFRTLWRYMPKFRIMDKNDFICTYGVFLMVFIFIFLICITAACVICYTRCQTIAVNNRYVFDDLKKLGAPPAFLKQEIKRQCCTVIRTPAIIGILMMTLLYMMIMYGNDGKITVSEILALGICGVVILLIILLLYAVYCLTVKALAKELEIEG